jgi:hypothetical protein
MTRAARSLFVFGAALVAAAVPLILAPNVVLGLLGMAPTTDPWIRVVGVVVAALGAYYIVAARAGLVPLLLASVRVRALVFLVFSVLVALHWVPASLILIGVVDALGAAWTWTALRS